METKVEGIKFLNKNMKNTNTIFLAQVK